MRLLFVAQEVGETPSGVFTILKELCKNWTAKDQIFLLANKSYRTEEEIKRKFTDIQKCKVFYCHIESRLKCLWRLIDCSNQFI